MEFCQDGLFVRVTRDVKSRRLRLTVEDSGDHVQTSFPCHIDELLAAAHGLTFQAGSADGHVLVQLDGNSVCLTFALGSRGTQSCVVPKQEFEQSLSRLKSELPA